MPISTPTSLLIQSKTLSKSILSAHLALPGVLQTTQEPSPSIYVLGFLYNKSNRGVLQTTPRLNALVPVPRHICKQNVNNQYNPLTKPEFMLYY
jgi:hypothetical protein